MDHITSWLDHLSSEPRSQQLISKDHRLLTGLEEVRFIILILILIHRIISICIGLHLILYLHCYVYCNLYNVCFNFSIFLDTFYFSCCGLLCWLICCQWNLKFSTIYFLGYLFLFLCRAWQIFFRAWTFTYAVEIKVVRWRTLKLNSVYAVRLSLYSNNYLQRYI